MSGWSRLIAIVAASFGGGGIAYAILTSADAPRWLVALSGLAACVSVAATVVLIALAFSVIAEDVRPSLRLRAPKVPIAITQNEPALLGRVRLRKHPVRFWGVLTLNNRFLLGFMVFDEPEYLDLRKATPDDQ